MTSPDNFADDYFSLNPEETSFSDAFRQLFSSNLETRSFVGNKKTQVFPFSTTGQTGITNICRRLIIFFTWIAEKLLILWRGPMALVGYVLEFWLNLFSGNGGLFNLLLNLLTWKFWWPNSHSPKFTSMIGHIDTRVELDKNIKPGDKKYKSALSMMAAKMSYENQAFIDTNITKHWKMKFLKFYNCWNEFQERYSTQAFMLQDTRSNPNLIVVAFRGTEPFDADDWRTDIDLSWYQLKGMQGAKTHSGFMQALGMQKTTGWPKNIERRIDLYAYYAIRKDLREVLQENPEAEFILTGHSLGGALAILFVSVLMLHEEDELLKRLDGVYTFGQPRVGDELFGDYMKEKMRKLNVKYFRYVYSNDMVPRVPYDGNVLLFKHFAPCLFVNCLYIEKILPEEPNKNYFSLIWMFPTMMIANWELMRGFMMPLMGADYKEGWVLRMWRMVGLMVPGVSAHAPQDYVNSTRLASLPSALLALDPLIDDELKTD
ncbi:hypothetical protein DITRI_Ditri03aG0192900 [Diplodiscus trichospermus]